MIINGDAFSEIKKIKKNSIDLILTDPPYLISKKSNFKESKKDGLLKKKYNISIDFGYWDKEELDWEYMFFEFYRVLKKSGTLIIFYDVWKCNEIKEAAEINKFKQPRVGIWVKNNPVPINSKINYLSNAIEYFFTFVKHSNPTFKSYYDNGIYNYPICHGKERYNHPTQKPLKLISDLIKKHSNEGDLVLDPFAGTGTVAHACINENRKYINIEKDENYFEIIKKRINKTDF